MQKNSPTYRLNTAETNYRLAKEIDVTQTSVKSWNTGERLPHPKTRKKIAEHYGITVEELMREDE